MYCSQLYLLQFITAANSELIPVELMKSYCLPFMLYASDVIPLSATDIRQLDYYTNRVVYKIFGIVEKDGVEQLRGFLGLSCPADITECRKD